MRRVWLVCAEDVAADAARREIGESLDVEVVAGGDQIETLIGKLPEIVT